MITATTNDKSLMLYLINLPLPKTIQELKEELNTIQKEGKDNPLYIIHCYDGINLYSIPLINDLRSLFDMGYISYLNGGGILITELGKDMMKIFKNPDGINGLRLRKCCDDCF